MTMSISHHPNQRVKSASRCGGVLTRLALSTAVLLGFCPPGVAEDPPSDRITQIDAQIQSGRVSSIDAEGTVRLADGTTTLKLDELSSIERPPKTGGAQMKPVILVELIGGGRLLGTAVAIKNQTCQLRCAEAEPLSLPVEWITAIRFQPEAKLPAVEAALKEPKRDADRVFVQAGEALQAVDGLIEELDEQQLSFEWKGKIRQVPRAGLRAVVLAVVGDPAKRNTSAVIATQGGTSVSGRIVSLANSKLSVEIAPKVNAVFDWQEVSSIKLRSSRLAYLSDLDPVEALDQPIVTLTMPWQRDRSVSGKPLSMSGRVYDKGLGVHARSLLRYDIGGRFDEFAAMIGLDAAAEGRGDCVFVVRADGRELLRQRVRGQDAPREIKLDVRGARQLTLLVEPGEDLDLADHANWSNAKLLKSRSQP